MPGWVEAGYAEYAKRLSSECVLNLIEIDPVRRGKSTSVSQARKEEGRRVLAAIPKAAVVIALDRRGQSWSTKDLARELTHWMSDGRDRALLVGGADGLSSDCLVRCTQRWALSALTFPHPLVRVIVAEQFYRAWSLTRGHPYHRGG